MGAPLSRRLLATTALPLLLFTGVARAGSHDAADGESPGQRDYRRYCASCHGVAADGRGPVAPALKTPPANLTRLAARFGSPLPRNKLLPFIDGRDAGRAHGTREMPVWGDVLYGELGGAREREMLVRGTIFGILDHLETMQVQDEDVGSDR